MQKDGLKWPAFGLLDHFETLQFANVFFQGGPSSDCTCQFQGCMFLHRGPKQVDTLWCNIPWILCLFLLSISSVPLPPSVFVPLFLLQSYISIRIRVYFVFGSLSLSLPNLCGVRAKKREHARTMGNALQLGPLTNENKTRNCESEEHVEIQQVR